MAHITKKKGSDKLYIDYCVKGKRIQRSTGLDDTAENRRILTTEVIPELEAKLVLGLVGSERMETFRDYGNEYLESKKMQKSYHTKKYVYEKVIKHFGDMKPKQITRMNIKRFLSSLSIQEASKKQYLTAIKGILDVALDDESIDKNVAVRIESIRTPKREIIPFSPEEVQAIIKGAEGMLRNYLGIAFYTGMRSGEILALMRNDISVDTININRSISKGRITTPKTLGSIRTIPMFDKVKPFIDDQLKRSKGLYLFTGEDGKLISDIGVLRKRKWKKLLNTLGIEYRKIYYTRHTFITAMLNSGNYKLTTIARIAGHRTIETLVENYAGFVKDDHIKIDYRDDIFTENSIQSDSLGESSVKVMRK